MYTVNGGLVCNKTTQMHIKLVERFDGEYIRNNDGTHLDGGIAYDKLWHEHYKRVVAYPLSQYVLPSSIVGR